MRRPSSAWCWARPRRRGASQRRDLKETWSSAVSAVLKRDNPRQPGVYKVKIAEIELDPKLFTEGRTVDIQARVASST